MTFPQSATRGRWLYPPYGPPRHDFALPADHDAVRRIRSLIGSGRLTAPLARLLALPDQQRDPELREAGHISAADAAGPPSHEQHAWHNAHLQRTGS